MDKTYLAARRQMKGMDCTTYDVGIRDTFGKMMSRIWKEETLLKSISFLKKVNFDGADIYIRPTESEGLILVDDLGLGTLARMDADSCNPAAVIQTSPQNYQAWVRVSRESLDTGVATQVAKLLAQRYGGDPNSADWHHYGRLAGFTNQKPIYRRPYVLAERCNGKLADNAAELLAEARKHIDVPEASTLAKHTSTPIQTPLRRDCDPVAYAASFYRTLEQKYAGSFDPSRADCMVASDLLRMGLNPDQVGSILAETSPDIASRKAGHIEDYLQRTIAAAMHRIEQGQRTR
jgi:hypothetical protein